MYGFPRALDPSPLMDIGLWLAMIGLILGIVAVFRKGRTRLARVGIYASGVVILVALVIPAL